MDIQGHITRTEACIASNNVFVGKDRSPAAANPCTRGCGLSIAFIALALTCGTIDYQYNNGLTLQTVLQIAPRIRPISPTTQVNNTVITPQRKSEKKKSVKWADLIWAERPSWKGALGPSGFAESTLRAAVERFEEKYTDYSYLKKDKIKPWLSQKEYTEIHAIEVEMEGDKYNVTIHANSRLQQGTSEYTGTVPLNYTGEEDIEKILRELLAAVLASNN